ncbi:MAG TPA: PLP-dependent aminotransferase family protein [Candidatus Baltobacteraceae bacterium]|nr:PLP-dependent aminotransferase family protein [Candidatus Baltobacteraceae bacterium]
MTSASTIDWSRRIARRARQMKPSALRELLKLSSRPEMISFAGGLPAAEMFPLDRVAAAVQSVLGQVGGRALQYGETEGVLELREWIAHHYSNANLSLKAENVLITTGAQQALDLVGRVLLDDGDRVIVENPTYMAALLAWQPCGAIFVPIGADSNGMKADELGPLLKEQPKMVYLIPNFQNPTGVTMTRERRQLLIDVLQGRDAVLFEDNPYAELRYEGEPLRSLLESDSPPDDGGRVIQAGTFSKTLMPGLRVGWVIGPRQIIERMGRAKQAMDLHTSTFNQYIALALLNSGYLEEFIPRLRRVYRERRDTMLAALQQHFPPGSCWTRPEGGMFIFVTLPEDVSAGSLLPRALERNVAFVPGEEFHLDDTGQNTMRLNFTKASVAEINSGISRLAEVIKLFSTGE